VIGRCFVVTSLGSRMHGSRSYLRVGRLPRKSLSPSKENRKPQMTRMTQILTDPIRAIRAIRDTLVIQGGRMETYRNFVDGVWAESASEKTAPNVNPATGETIGTVRLSTREGARAAVEAAARAFGAWRATPAPARGRIVARAARLVDEDREHLAALLTREEGKTLAESRGELQRAVNVAEFCAGEARRMTGESIPSELPSNFAYT